MAQVVSGELQMLASRRVKNNLGKKPASVALDRHVLYMIYNVPSYPAAFAVD